MGFAASEGGASGEGQPAVERRQSVHGPGREAGRRHDGASRPFDSLDVANDEVKGWFEKLPELPLPPGGDGAAVWFDDYAEVRDPLRLRTFGEVGSDDMFSRWQGQLQKALGGQAQFQRRSASPARAENEGNHDSILDVRNLRDNLRDARRADRRGGPA